MGFKVLFALVLVLLVSEFPEVAGYEESVDCPVRDPASRCTCQVIPSANVRDIQCSNKGLTKMPHFKPSSFPFIGLRLGRNKLRGINASVFTNLNFTELYLNDNEIAFLDNETFTSLENQLTHLDLRNNMLVSLPDCLAKLTKIAFLDVAYNPIPHTGFTDTIMRKLGDYIHEFRFGGPELNEWPASMHHLQALQILKFYGGKMERFNMSAFSGFEWTLEKLWIQNTRLISVPMALQNLHSVNEFHFDNNVHVKDAGILIPAFTGLSETLTTLTLENNSLTVFPSVLRTLTGISNLSLARNDLEFVSDQTVSNIGSDLTTLNLVKCNLDRIPGALSRLGDLRNLDLSNNSITTIEKNDLQSMENLTSLNLSYNPLEYVSSKTFNDLKSMREIVMKETYLYLVPEAIQNIPSLEVLDLSSEQPIVECTCDLSWLWCFITYNTTADLRVLGECQTIRSDIDGYVKHKLQAVCLPTCPPPS